MPNKIDLIWLSQQIGRPSIYNIVNTITALVKKGEITAGISLPSIRALANELNTSPPTISKAWKELKNRNIIRTRQGYGAVVIDNPVMEFPFRFIDYSANRNLSPLLDLSGSNPDSDLLPKLDKALKSASKYNTFNYIKYCPIAPKLKEAVLPGWPYQAENFIAFDKIFEAVTHLLKLFVPPNAYVAIEDPTTIGILDILKRSNIKLIAVECDQEGPILASLTKALAKKPALFIYQPREHLATSHSVSQARMAGMVKLCASSHTLLIENDVIGDLSLLPPCSIGRYLPEKTVYIRSYTKAYGNDFCFTVLSGPKKILEQLYNYRIYSLGWSNQLLQNALAYLVQDAKNQLELIQTKEKYNQRYQAFLLKLEERKIRIDRDNGLHLSLWLPVYSEQEVLSRLKTQGIIALGGSNFMTGQHKQNYIRIMTSCLFTGKLVNQVADAIAYAITSDSHSK